MEQPHRAALEARLGRAHLLQRLGMEGERESGAAPPGRHVLDPRNLLSRNGLIRAGLTLSGMRGRGRRNVLNIQLRHNQVQLRRLPAACEGFTLLHLSDLHLDLDAMPRHGRLHLGGVRIVDRGRAPELPARGHAAPSAARLTESAPGAHHRQ